MWLYKVLCRGPLRRTYLGKVLFVSFLGVHVPMLGAVTFVLLSDARSVWDQLDVLGAMLAATLIGTIVTLLALRALLGPVDAATVAIHGYLREKKTPRLPSTLPDEAGLLLASVQEGVTRLDAALTAAELRRETLERTHADTFRTVAGLGHDLRTPLNHILGMAQLMSMETLGPLGEQAYKRNVNVIGEAGTELLRTLQAVLDFSETEANALEASPATARVDLHRLAREAVDLEHLHSQARAVRVAEGALRDVVAATDPAAAKQLVISLLQLAVEDAGEAGVVSLDVTETIDGRPVMRVEDRGRAMTLEDVPPELRSQTPDLPAYAGAFGASEASTSTSALRLALICSLARLAGAEVRLEAAPEGGKAVSVVFRRGDAAAAPKAAAA